MTSRTTVPASSFSEALLTTTLRSASSPSRRKRGTYGRTISSLTRPRLLVERAAPQVPRDRRGPRRSTTSRNRGRVNSIVAEPSGPVRSCGDEERRLGEVAPEGGRRGRFRQSDGHSPSLVFIFLSKRIFRSSPLRPSGSPARSPPCRSARPSSPSPARGRRRRRLP